ncbi:DUF1593-domain-containing protein [Periconia macrospinosa]|uniref:DUF1593-domain-containing protein n=1 Tax=Periconia macrospinosa TaxID=97972 RepID=A0A2V1DGL1_9PLEO|nr:DUF1593-domain-containing protein [Periconia macrospinosa]
MVSSRLFHLASVAASVSILVTAALTPSSQCEPWTVNKPNRIFVLTDISNEPDDSMSLVRLLSHADMYTVEGLVATTSFWLPNGTRPDEIHKAVDAYRQVRENLQSHSNYTFPTAEYLSAKIASGPTVYGMEAIEVLEEGGNITVGSAALIAATDASDEPLYVQLWGGANALAAALWYVNRTRSADELSVFTSKLRVYSISDQDDAGPWARQHFPGMRWIASRAAFNNYGAAAWGGISGNPGAVDAGGPNDTIVQNKWLDQNIRLGPLGAHYPQIQYIMEGDTPTLMYNFDNGLGNPEYPSWGSWGGRYGANPPNSYAQYGDALDSVVGLNNRTYNTNKATVWRWREAFQNEFAARMQWTLAPNAQNSTSTHPPIVVVNASCGSSHLEYNVTVGDVITLDATSTYSPDTNADLAFKWWQYKEPSTWSNNVGVVPSINLSLSNGSESSAVKFEVPPHPTGFCLAPESVKGTGQFKEATKCQTLHVLVKVWDRAARYPIERYRRVLLRVQPYGTAPA